MHQEFAADLLVVLKPFVASRRLGVIYIAPFDVILEETSVIVPDLLFVAQDRVGVVTDRGVRGAPDLIVEILSPGTARRDRVEKAKLNARPGVGHYRLADPEARIFDVYELTEGQYRRIGQPGWRRQLLSLAVPAAHHPAVLPVGVACLPAFVTLAGERSTT